MLHVTLHNKVILFTMTDSNWGQTKRQLRPNTSRYMSITLLNC